MCSSCDKLICNTSKRGKRGRGNGAVPTHGSIRGLLLSENKGECIEWKKGWLQHFTGWTGILGKPSYTNSILQDSSAFGGILFIPGSSLPDKLYTINTKGWESSVPGMLSSDLLPQLKSYKVWECSPLHLNLKIQLLLSWAAKAQSWQHCSSAAKAILLLWSCWKESSWREPLHEPSYFITDAIWLFDENL